MWELYPECHRRSQATAPIVFDWRSFPTSMAVCVRSWSASASRNISATSSSRAKSGPINPTRKFSRRALKFLNLRPENVLHVGDDPERDWRAAAAAGLSIFKLDRSQELAARPARASVAARSVYRAEASSEGGRPSP